MKDNLNLLVKDSNLNKNYKIAYKKAKVLGHWKDKLHCQRNSNKIMMKKI
jgi:hypothetical protein